MARGDELAAETLAILSRLGTVAESAIDYPVTGMAVLALARWLLRRQPTATPSRLSGCSRWPTGSATTGGSPRWPGSPSRQLADDAAPGLLAAVLEEYGERKGRELRDEAGRVLASVDAHIFRVKLRTDSGAKIATTTAQPSSAQPASAPTWPLLARSRMAEMTCETGFTSAKDCSQPGIVSVGTNAFERNVSGNITISEMACTPCALRPIVPNHAKIHASDQPAMIAKHDRAERHRGRRRPGGSPAR